MLKNPYSGKFIVFEGLDGSGKTTQVALLAKHFKKEKQKVHLTAEPTNFAIGKLIKSYVSGHSKISNKCLQLLFTADRAYHLEKEIIPLLKKGTIIICDRYFLSTLAYGALDVDFDWLLNLNKNFILPDITFLLKVSPEICIKRIKKERSSRTLFEKETKLKKVWQNYQKLAQQFKNIYLIDGEKPINEISNEIKKILTSK
ncbi:MAG TPA: dTMP kinase [Candidatus Pacearchaeota archaeon]|nr:dTMP kinase [Candidatus Pacearchaeota archaeon]HOK94072.1 dTMP kinase [Candidatus Pacearchaeota archaeon]HPO75143.1 dTMP kinase [Candidatus Pacearchaeota archaeon]